MPRGRFFARGPLAVPTFRRLFFGQAFSYVGDGLRTVALPLLVYHMTGSAASLATTFAIEFGVTALTGLFGGSLADRLNRRRLLVTCDAVRALTLGLFAFGSVVGTLPLWSLYVAVAIVSACGGVFFNGQAPTIPYVVGKEHAVEAVSLLQTVEQGSQLIVPPIGGAIFSTLGALPALAVNAATYLLSLVQIARAGPLGPDDPGGMPTPRELLADVGLGLAYLRRDAAMFAITICNLFFNILSIMTSAIIFAYYKQAFGASDFAVGVAQGATAVGAIAGAAVAGRIGNRYPFGRTIRIAYLVAGCTFFPMMLARNLIVVVLFFALCEGVFFFQGVQIIGWRMRIIPPELTGRVLGVVRLIAIVGGVPGALLGGVLAQYGGVHLPLVVSGFAYTLVACVTWFLPVLRADAR